LADLIPADLNGD